MRRRGRCWVFFAWAVMLCHAGGALAADAPQPKPVSAKPLVCIIIRTYWGHGSYGQYELWRLFHALKAQTHTRWDAQIVVLDNRPFPDLRFLVREAHDERIRVFAEWISYKFSPRTPDDSAWSKDYHTRLYNLTDAAIRACPRDTRWVVATNGDNVYDKYFLHTLVTHADADVVAFDYYTRFQHATGLPCERFAEASDAAPCKENRMRWCHTDLAANAFSWPKLIAEDVRFGHQKGGSSEGHDGQVAELVVRNGWKVRRMDGVCLVNHSPSPQLCARDGGVWDDSLAATSAHLAGRCLDATAANALLFNPAGGLEAVHINITHDPLNSFAIPGNKPLTLKCLRKKDPDTWGALKAFFAACDLPRPVTGGEQGVNAVAATEGHGQGSDEGDEYAAEEGGGDEGEAEVERVEGEAGAAAPAEEGEL